LSSERPKASLVGIGDLGLSVLNTSKIRSLTSDIGNLGSGVDALDTNIRQLSKAFNSEIEEHRAHIYEQNRTIEEYKNEALSNQGTILKGLLGFESQMSNLENRMDSRLLGIENKIDRIRSRDEQPGLLRLLIKNTEDELQKIEQISGDFLEFAALMAENLVVLANREEVQIYKYLSGEDLRWARDVFQSVQDLDNKLQKLLRE
jgi:hypothetical protein